MKGLGRLILTLVLAMRPNVSGRVLGSSSPRGQPLIPPYVSGQANARLGTKPATDALDENSIVPRQGMEILPRIGEAFFEGDIILRPDQDERNLVLPTQLWPNGELPYSFDRGFTDEDKYKIESALYSLQRETCVRFVRRSNQRNYINIKNSGLGCASEVGYFNKGYATDLHLTTPSCISKPGTIQHEFLHALGFWHEHTRPDRDNYVKIAWNNVVKGKEDNFLARPVDDVQTLGSPYDYGSVMHYPSTAFSKDGISATIIPFKNDVLFTMGQRDKYSKVDLAKLNRLYKCSGYFQDF